MDALSGELLTPKNRRFECGPPIQRHDGLGELSGSESEFSRVDA